jgi:hypothetical protein
MTTNSVRSIIGDVPNVCPHPLTGRINTALGPFCTFCDTQLPEEKNVNPSRRVPSKRRRWSGKSA